MSRYSFGFLRLGFALSVSLMMAACGGSSSSDNTPSPGPSGALPYANGDGIPEITAVPSFSPTSVAIGDSVTVNVPVDSDTSYSWVLVGIFDGIDNLDIYGASDIVNVTGGTASIPVLVGGFFDAVPGTYVANITACADADCSGTYRVYFPESTYLKFNPDTSGFTDTGVVPPTFTVTAGPAGPASPPAAAGSLDATFGTGGLVTYDSGNAAALDSVKDIGAGITLDAAGNILVTGQSTNGPTNNNNDMTIWRYDATGTLDDTFGSSGIVVSDSVAGGSYDAGGAIAIVNGDIVVAGLADSQIDTDLAIWRYDPTGTLDTTFGADGVVVYDSTKAERTESNPMAIDGDKILVTGASRVGGPNGNDWDNMRIWRYTSTGALDTNFSGDGIAEFDNGFGDAVGRAIALQVDGKILVAGSSRNANGNDDLAVWRYNTDGTLDTAFNTTGYVTYDGGDGNDTGDAIAVDTAGNILVAGAVSNATDEDMVLRRYTSTGALDTGFGTGGMVLYSGGFGNDAGLAMILDAAGNILVTGIVTNTAGDWDLAVWRFTSEGVLDSTFGTGGLVTYSGASGSVDIGRGIALAASGKILVTGGTGGTSISTLDMAIWRFND